MILFITGTGTGVGKTLTSAIITEALEADYWKPVQTGSEEISDTETVSSLLSNSVSRIHAERYKLKLPTSPHLAAEEEGVHITVESITDHFRHLHSVNKHIVIEGAGGLLVPLNKTEFMIDLIEALKANVIIVSQNYLGSINHSLLTAEVCQKRKLKVLGWVFNGQYLDYENDIVEWSKTPWIASLRPLPLINKEVVKEQAEKMRDHLKLFV